MTRLTAAWGALDRERRLATLASVGLFISMFLPWYQQNAVVSALRAAPLQSRNLDAFQVFSFVEAAVLLVAMALLYMLFARAEGRDFNLPGGDGTIVLTAGGWAALLLVFRLFDKPGISARGVAGNVGVQWGIFFALVAAGTVAYAGSRMRSEEREEPDARPSRVRPARPTDRVGPLDTSAAPGTEAAVRTAPHEEPTTVLTAPPVGAKAPGVRPPFPPSPSEQLSFEDAKGRPS